MMLVAISEVMDGRPVHKWRKEERPCMHRIAETGRRKDSLSMTAGRVLDFEGVDIGVDVPEVAVPLI